MGKKFYLPKYINQMFLERLIWRQILIFLEPIHEKLFRDDEDKSANENVVVDKMINENREENIAFNEIPDVESKEEWIFTAFDFECKSRLCFWVGSTYPNVSKKSYESSIKSINPTH